jgi:cell division protease FtsH
MMCQLQNFTANHRYLLNEIARLTGMADPMAVVPGELYHPLLKSSRKQDLLPIDGVLIRSWDPDNWRHMAGISLGARRFVIDGIPFIDVQMDMDNHADASALSFIAVARADYRRLYRRALRARRKVEAMTVQPPILATHLKDTLWQNTIGYLERTKLRRIRLYGGRPRRGVLLYGAPGNGKTMACRWLWSECRLRNWEWKILTPDHYRAARGSSDPVEAIRELFSVQRRGIIFFDDMDIALRDRESVGESDDQSIFLTALDGIKSKEGVVYIFTTNCALNLIDRAFKRPGRIDVLLHLEPPDGSLRRQLFERWHEDIRQGLNVDEAVAQTASFSFAELEEVKNLLIMRYIESERWEWTWAMDQFHANRAEFNLRNRNIGFGPAQPEQENGAQSPVHRAIGFGK